MAQFSRDHTSTICDRTATRMVVAGSVQGVGFRPFVYRLARDQGILGSVCNMLGEVEIVAYGAPTALSSFAKAVVENAPPLAHPKLVSEVACDIDPPEKFEILDSDSSSTASISVPADFFTCDDCLAELSSPEDRRFNYPFINCTQCGPRYTLINRLPYDRRNTSMESFELCVHCRAEYEDPLDRRFHAEPIACPDCGPTLEYFEENLLYTSDEPLADAVVAILRGRIVAVKGVGGYHLLCDASNDQAIARLRQRKHRPNKPLAVMFPINGDDGLDAVRKEVFVSRESGRLITGPTRPIVLVKRRPESSLPLRIAPGLNELGVFLPYSPLHALLLGQCGRPLVATSGNISGEPVLTENQEVRRRLVSVADAFLLHDRPIVRPADDSIYRLIDGVPYPLRLGRGAAPLELTLPFKLQQPVLAVGAHQKNTIALAWEDRVVLSPHIGDMGTVRSMDVFAQVVEDLQSLYDVQAQHLICDDHTGYETHRWARRSGMPMTSVLHHHAHASSLMGDVGECGRCLVLTWDGVGLGSDGTLWGGETFFGQPGAWSRVASMRSFSLPGGERAGREPWRSAAGLCWETGQSFCPDVNLGELAYEAWQHGVNSPKTSAVGRLFDGFAALATGISKTSYEGQAPMVLEASCGTSGEPVDLPFYPDDDGVLRVDWQPLIQLALDNERPLSERALSFHLSLAKCVVDQAQHFRSVLGIETVGLTGGVFQNRILTEAACHGLMEAGFKVCRSRRVPCNDGGLSLGQVLEFAARENLRNSKRSTRT